MFELLLSAAAKLLLLEMNSRNGPALLHTIGRIFTNGAWLPRRCWRVVCIVFCMYWWRFSYWQRTIFGCECGIISTGFSVVLQTPRIWKSHFPWTWKVLEV